MTGLGDRLKEARKAKGYTLEDLQSITKIQKRYLAGIENEDYSMMPGSFYVRAFIKQYADAVELDADEMLALYKETPASSLPEDEEQQIDSTNLSRRSNARRTSQLNEFMPKIIVALFIIVIILVVWFLMLNNPSKKQELNVDMDDQIKIEDQQKKDDNQKADDDKKDEDSEEGTDDKNENDEKEEEPPAKQTLTHESVNGEDSRYTLKDAEQLHLKIETSNDSWIGVQNRDGEEQMPKPRGADTFGAGESVELDVSELDYIRIRVGRIASTNIYINDELLNYESDRITQNIIIERE